MWPPGLRSRVLTSMNRAGQAYAETTNPAASAFLRSAAFNAVPNRPKERPPRKLSKMPTGLSPSDYPLVLRVVETVSPRSGRQHVAHGVSRGWADATLTPSPLPPQRERGAEGGVRAIPPRAYALGYSMPPLTGLQSHHRDKCAESTGR